MEPMTLKGISAELKIEPRVAREKLRAAIREPNEPGKGAQTTSAVGIGKGLTRREGSARGAH